MMAQKNTPAAQVRTAGASYQAGLHRGGGIHGAHIRTGAAVNAGISIDVVLGITLGNGRHRALGLACAAADASIRNLVGHRSYLQK